MKDLKDMSIGEVLEKIGIFASNIDFQIFIKDERLIEEINNLFSQKRHTTKMDYITNFIKENEKNIDIEKFVLTQLYRMETVKREMKKENKRFEIKQVGEKVSVPEESIERKMNIAKELLKNYKGSILILDENNKEQIVNMDILNNGKTSQKNTQKLQKLDENESLDLICSTLSWEDIPDLVSSNDPNFSEYLIDYTVQNTVNNTLPTYYNCSEQEIEKHMQTPEYRKEFYKRLKETFKEYSKFIQVDKMMAIGIYRNLKYLDVKEIEGNMCKLIIEQLKEIYNQIDPKTKTSKSKFKILEDTDSQEKISIFPKELKKMLDENFIDNKFIGKNTIKAMKREILEYEVPLTEYDPIVLKLLEINMDELMQILNNPSNFEYLMQYEMINDEVLEYVLNTKNDMPVKIYEQLLNGGMIDKQYILDLYSDGIITLEQIKELNEFSELHIEEIAQEEEMIRLYKEFYMYGKDEETFNSYMQLYKELRVKGKDISEKRDNGNRLVEELGEDFEEEDLKQMYKLGIIPVDTAIEWGGDSITQDMFNKGILKPIDAKRLYKENVLNLDMIKQVLRSKEISDEDKLALIGSTFDGEEDFETKMELMQYLNLVANENSSKGKGQKRLRRTDTKIEAKNAYITDPFARWQLISLLDNEYSQEVLRDGYIIFELPNVNDGTVIIEKMFKKSQNRVVPSYGNATYILSKKQFDKSKNYITDETLGGKVINLGELAEVREARNADRLNHSSRWGSNIKDYFEVGKDQSRYTEEQIQKIDKTIESIENSRRLK